MAKSSKIPTYDKAAFYPLGTQVRKVEAGFNSKDVLGIVIGHDFFGAAKVRWEPQEILL